MRNRLCVPKLVMVSDYDVLVCFFARRSLRGDPAPVGPP